MAQLILTVVGPDRPGLVRLVSEAVAARGGNWLESRMARLGGQFAGIVMVEAPASLAAELEKLADDGLLVTVLVAGGAPETIPSGTVRTLEVVGNDRPGIVHEVTQVLAARGVNIEDMSTNVTNGAFSGGQLFRANIVVRAPSEAAMQEVSAALELLGPDMMVDIQAAEG